MIDDKTAVLAALLAERLKPGEQLGRTLVVGCGLGFEAVDLASLLHTHVEAIDVENRVNVSHPDVCFSLMDARQMSFAAASFDFVYSFHTLEHIPEPGRAIAEMARVLRPGGLFLIGTPNKSRLLHNIGWRGASLKSKILSNLGDWKMRLTGRFRNECGAHAGFTIEELFALCAPLGIPRSVAIDYYLRLYPRHAWVVHSAETLHLTRWILPSHYLIGRKPSA